MRVSGAAQGAAARHILIRDRRHVQGCMASSTDDHSSHVLPCWLIREPHRADQVGSRRMSQWQWHAARSPPPHPPRLKSVVMDRTSAAEATQDGGGARVLSHA